MDYKQRYKESLKVIEGLYNVVRYQSSTDALLASQTIEKAFPELTESEDERIRKEIIEYITCYTDSLETEEYYSWIDWLEKQGEHEKFRQKIQIGDQVTRNQDGELINLSQLKRVAKSSEKQKPSQQMIAGAAKEAIFPDYTNVNVPQKDWAEPKQEWSEEDEHRIGDAIYFLETARKHYASVVEINKTIDWLKSLKPRWKPSEEQMQALKKRTYGLHTNSETRKVLEGLIDDLKKL